MRGEVDTIVPDAPGWAWQEALRMRTRETRPWDTASPERKGAEGSCQEPAQAHLPGEAGLRGRWAGLSPLLGGRFFHPKAIVCL